MNERKDSSGTNPPAKGGQPVVGAPVGRNIYLKMKTPQQARELFFDRFSWNTALASERVSTANAVGRVLAEPVHAALSSPSYHGAAMDGIALCAEETYGASDARPKELELSKSAHWINTGEPLPPGTNAVIMIEQVWALEGAERVRIEAPAFPWQHVRRVGEDIVATEMLFTRGHQIGPYCVGALLAGGVRSVTVKKRPRVLIIPTGAEIVDLESLAKGAAPRPGAIIEFNSSVLGSLVEECGGQYLRHDPIADDIAEISRAVTDGVDGDFDAVLVIGGSSAGAKDLTRAAIAQVGEVLVHGVTIMPGKPTVLAAVHDTPVIGVPGYPVSAIVAFEEFVGPALSRMLGVPGKERPTALALPTRKIASKLGMEELVRVRLGRVGETLVATPMPRGAGTVTSITEADGIIRVPAELEGLRAREAVRVELLRPLAAIEQNLVAVGSHDLALDVLADLLRGRQAGVAMSSSHVGSLGGIMALENGCCHLAGCHLLDTEDGSYNKSYLKRYLHKAKVKLVHLVERQQGLMVKPGNPLGITGLADLSGTDLRFVNRQSGSGTRILLDYQLQQQGIKAEAISGYQTEEFTHMAVAVAVLSDAADVGLGIRAAARALGLDFIEVASESYDLAIREEFFDSPAIEILLEVIRSAEFEKRVNELGGYSTARTGTLLE